MKVARTDPKKSLFFRAPILPEDERDFFGGLLNDQKEIDELLNDDNLFAALEERDCEDLLGPPNRSSYYHRRSSKFASADLAHLIRGSETNPRTNESGQSPGFSPKRANAAVKRIALKDTEQEEFQKVIAHVLTPRPRKKPKSAMQIRERKQHALVIDANGMTQKRRSMRDLFYSPEASPILRQDSMRKAAKHYFTAEPQLLEHFDEEEIKVSEVRIDTEEYSESEVNEEKDEESWLPGSPTRQSLWTPVASNSENGLMVVLEVCRPEGATAGAERRRTLRKTEKPAELWGGNCSESGVGTPLASEPLSEGGGEGHANHEESKIVSPESFRGISNEGEVNNPLGMVFQLTTVDSFEFGRPVSMPLGKAAQANPVLLKEDFLDGELITP